MKLLWTPAAIRCLPEIEEFIARDIAEQAIEFINHLMEQPDALLKNPRIGRIVPELSNESIREIVYKKYRIVYQIKTIQIEGLTVFEGHQLFRKNEI